MSFTETTSKSWFSRIGGAIGGFFFGIIVVIVAIVALFLNEGWSIHTYRALAEGAGAVINVESKAVDPANEGKLIHISGPVTVNDVPTDDTFGVAAQGAVSLVRNVEFYQWVENSKSETQNKVGGGSETVTTYSYAKEWRSDFVDSSKFKVSDGHSNPQPLIDKGEYIVKQANVGAFQVDGAKLASIGDAKQLPMTAEDADYFKSAIATDMPFKASAGIIYVGDSASSPQIGDMKISYERTDIAEASVVAAQDHQGLSDYTTSNGNTIFLTAAGDKNAPTMFAKAQADNATLTWIIRGAGLIGLFIGFVLIFAIFGVVGDFIPFIGSIIGFGTTLVAFLLAVIIGPVVIALAWFTYRPLLAIGILAVAALIVAAVVYLRRGKVKAAATAA